MSVRFPRGFSSNRNLSPPCVMTLNRNDAGRESVVRSVIPWEIRSLNPTLKAGSFGVWWPRLFDQRTSLRIDLRGKDEGAMRSPTSIAQLSIPRHTLFGPLKGFHGRSAHHSSDECQ